MIYRTKRIIHILIFLNKNAAARSAERTISRGFVETPIYQVLLAAVVLVGSGLNFFGAVNINYYYQIWVCVRRGMGAIGKPPKKARTSDVRGKKFSGKIVR